VANRWLERLGFRPRLVERCFDENFRRHLDEPSLAFCGFDGQGPRWALDDAGFEHVIECGLGGTFGDFDLLHCHTLGSPSPPSLDLWPKSDARTTFRHSSALELADHNPVYRALGLSRLCGHIELAGLSVAVPFVGAVAAALVFAEILRSFHDGERYEHLRWQLGFAGPVVARIAANGYRGRHRPRIGHQPV
jgi:hypothetical protein